MIKEVRKLRYFELCLGYIDFCGVNYIYINMDVMFTSSVRIFPLYSLYSDRQTELQDGFFSGNESTIV